MPEVKEFDFTNADNTGVSLGSSWGIIEEGKLVNVVEERTVPSVVHRLFEESKVNPQRLYVLGRFIHNGLTVKQTFMHNETWNLIRNGKIIVIGVERVERYHKSLGLPEEKHWVLIPDREEAYAQLKVEMNL